MNTYISKEGDTADLVAFNYYGSTQGRIVERLLDANPGLADYGPQLPAGVRIALPEMNAQETAQGKGLKLWN